MRPVSPTLVGLETARLSHRHADCASLFQSQADMTHLEALLELLILVIAAARRPRHRDESPRALLSRPPSCSWCSPFTSPRRDVSTAPLFSVELFFARNISTKIMPKTIRGPEPGAHVLEPLPLTRMLGSPTDVSLRSLLSFFVFLYLSVCEASKLRSLPFTHPIYVASRYFQ